jgi:hypothetical protein
MGETTSFAFAGAGGGVVGGGVAGGGNGLGGVSLDAVTLATIEAVMMPPVELNSTALW